MIVREGGASVDAPADREGLGPLELLQRRLDDKVAAGRRADGAELYSWGHASNVGLGRAVASTKKAEAAPARVELPAAASFAAAAKHHMLVADNTGAVHACGLGVGGRLGLGDEAAVVQPVALPRFTTRVVSLACGLDHSVAVGECGGVWSWGAEGAPLGYQASAPQTTPRRVKFVSSADEQRRDKVHACRAAAADGHTLVVARDGALWGWGGTRTASSRWGRTRRRR